jgi:hypothetical protein
MRPKRNIEYAKKVFIYRKGGERAERVFDIRGKNKKAREMADGMASVEIKRMICEDDCDLLTIVYREPIN